VRLSLIVVVALFVAMDARPARAGTASIVPSSSEITLGQTVTVTVSVDSADPTPVTPDTLVNGNIFLTASGPTTITATNFKLASDVPPNSKLALTFSATGSAELLFEAAGLSSFLGDLYSFEFTPTRAGTYGFTLSGPPDTNDLLYFGGEDKLTLTAPASIQVVSAAVPEPGSLTLVALCLTAVGARRMHKRRAS
jgi:hypothetical protein